MSSIYFGPTTQDNHKNWERSTENVVVPKHVDVTGNPSAAGAVGQQKLRARRRNRVIIDSFSTTPTIAPRRTPGFRYGMGLAGIISPIQGFNFQNGFTDSYGPRIHPITGRPSFHTGTDMPAAMGTPIRAVAGGVVMKATADGGAYGNEVVLDHGKDQETMYGHMSDFVVSVGDRVKRGQVIGYVGTTGLSTGPHLHFETWNNMKPVDPMNYLRILG